MMSGSVVRTAQEKAWTRAYIVIVLLVVKLAAAHDRCWRGVALLLALVVCE